ncbi:MAG: ornithine decarboxylase, partial [Sedimentitalea sp.]|nr:ornithine decarboxylase [Sedimentitalea sp.]
MPSVNDYYSAVQLRADQWSALRESAISIKREGNARRVARLQKRIEELFESLALIEPFWAFPGMAAFDHMRRQFEHGNLDDLSFAVSRVTRALTTGAYRRRHIPLERDSIDQDEHEDEALLSPEARALTKPYFEVLIVDSVNEHQERWLKNNVTRMRRPEDPFIYEAVVVPSLEDALLAVLINHNIQAIVVRPGLVLKSRADQATLNRYLNRARGQEEIEALQPE